MKQFPHFNVEDEFTKAIASIGGHVASAYLGLLPSDENADFVFPSENVVVELKCLNEDKISDARIIEKASKLYLKELEKGPALPVAFGTVQLTTKGFSEEYTRKIADLYRVPIERQIKKADRQIAATISALGAASTAGLLLVANNNHTALDPWHAVCLVNEILTKPDYSNISAAVIFSGNLAATMPGETRRIDYWIQINRSNALTMDHFSVRLRAAWHAHMEKLFGCHSAFQLESDMETLVRLESR